MVANKKIKSDLLIYIYIHYIVAVWCCDAIDVVAMMLGISQATAFSRLLILFLMAVIVKVDCKYFEFEKKKWQVVDVVAIFGLVLLGLYMSIYPDISYDVICYHMINQEPGWGNYEGYFREIYSPLADRIFYLFRFVFGYRLGTLLNTFIYILTYFQCKKVFEVLFKINEKKHSVVFQPGVLSILCLSLEAALMDLGTYMTDLVGIPLILEAVFILIQEENEKKEYFSEMIYYVILMACLFLFKVSAAIYILPLLIIYLWKRRAELTVEKFLVCLGVAVFTLVPEMIYNLLVTGTPLFELFTLLGSAAAGNGMGDVRWGGQTVLEKALWPIYMAFYPHYRHMELIDIPNFYPLLAFAVILIAGRRYMDKKSRTLFGIFVISFYLWVFMGGVDRYILAAIVLAGIFTCYVAYRLVNDNKKVRGYVLIGVCFLQSIGSFLGILYFNNNWQCAPSVIQQVTSGDFSFTNQIKYWCKDRGDLIEDGNKYKYFIVPERPYAGYAAAVNDEAEILEIYFQNYGNEKTTQYIYQWLNKVQESGEEIYSICALKDTVSIMEGLSTYGLRVVEVETFKQTYLGSVSILKIDIDNEVNTICTVGSDNYVECAEITEEGKYDIKSLVMIEPTITWTNNPLKLSLYFDNGKEYRELETVEVSPGKPIVYNYQFESEDTGKILAKASEDYSLGIDVIYLVNFKVE